MEIQFILNQYYFNFEYAKQLVADIEEAQMTIIPNDGLVNHPAFTLGHLVSGSALLAEDLGADFDMLPGWSELFIRNGPGDPRTPDTDHSKYPSKLELLAELERQHNNVSLLLKEIAPTKFMEPTKWRFSKYMPTLYDIVIFMCINHEAMHLGQLAAWRRAMGMDSALAKL